MRELARKGGKVNAFAKVAELQEIMRKKIDGLKNPDQDIKVYDKQTI